MFRPSSNVLTFSLLGLGAVAWFAASRPLTEDTSLRIPSNPLGVKRSPYGEVFAMAMQGPIDTYWHGGDECHDENCTNPAHHHHHEEAETPEQHAAELAEAKAQSHPLDERFTSFLNELNEISEQRTNPREPTPGQLFARRREIENKLRFAYELDPSHYGNYNTYHLFLTEPDLGTRPVLTPAAVKLAQETIDYCLRRDDDPRPALTAAAAAENELDLMFQLPYKYKTSELRKVLAVVDYSLVRHQEIAHRWIASGDWARLSQQRQDEIAERYRFVSRIRDADESTILRLEGKRPTGQASN